MAYASPFPTDTACWVPATISIADVLDGRTDSVRMIGLDGAIACGMAHGLPAVAVDDAGVQWGAAWPDEARGAVAAAYARAAAGETARFRTARAGGDGAPRWCDVTLTKVTDARGRHAGYLAVVRDVTDQHDAQEALEIAIAEMKHRLKNTYMVVSSLMMGFARGDAAREAFAEEMGDRLGALSTAQSLFTANEASCEIARLIPSLLTPFDNPGCRVAIDPLPQARVDQGQADAIALVIGELSVNSAKHGALVHGGGIRLTAAVTDGGLVLRWIERSAVPPQAHDRSGGQGLALIRRIVGARRGTMELAWTASGLEVEIRFRLG